MTALASSSHRTVHLPHAHPDASTWSALVAEYRSFRLFALLSNPEAFASTFAAEAGFESSVWEGRLRDAGANVFVAVAEDEVERVGDDLVLALSGTWVGTVVILGPNDRRAVRAGESPWRTPMTSNSAASSSESNASKTDAKVAHYHLNTVFTHPKWRRRGTSRALIDAALAHVRGQCVEKRIESIRCTVFVERDNKAAMMLYQSAGFSKVAEEVVQSPRRDMPNGEVVDERQVTVCTMETRMTVL